MFIADWAWHLPGEPVGPPARWAATSNVEVSQRTYPLNNRREERMGGKRAQDKVIKKRRGKDDEEQAPRVPCYATTDGAGLPAYPGPV